VSDHESLQQLLLERSVRRGDFLLASGARSSYYIDCRPATMSAAGMVLIGRLGMGVIKATGWKPDGVGGLTMGADPVAFGVAAIGATRGRKLRSFSVRKEAKDHGVRGRLAGALQPGDKVVITEDTTTRGTSLMEAVDVVRQFGAEPVLVTVIVDRGGTCAAICEVANVAYAPLLTAPDLGFSYGS